MLHRTCIVGEDLCHIVVPFFLERTAVHVLLRPPRKHNLTKARKKNSVEGLAQSFPSVCLSEVIEARSTTATGEGLSEFASTKTQPAKDSSEANEGPPRSNREAPATQTTILDMRPCTVAKSEEGSSRPFCRVTFFATIDKDLSTTENSYLHSIMKIYHVNTVEWKRWTRMIVAMRMLAWLLIYHAQFDKNFVKSHQ